MQPFKLVGLEFLTGEIGALILADISIHIINIEVQVHVKIYFHHF